MGDWSWPHLVPEPRWNALDAPPEVILALGAGPSVVRARAYYMLGESLLQRTKAEEQDAAIYSYVAAHVLRPEAAAYINLGVALRQSDRTAAARSAFALAVAHTPSVAAAHTNLASLPGTAPAEAVALLQKAVAAVPQSAELRLALGSALRRGQPAAAAVQTLGAAVALAPTSVASTHALGAALLASSRAAEALPLLRRARTAAPADASVVFWEGTALQAAYRLREAALCFDAALRLEPLLSVRTREAGGGLPWEALAAEARASLETWARVAAGEDREGAARQGGTAGKVDVGGGLSGGESGKGGKGDEGGEGGEGGEAEDGASSPPGAAACAVAAPRDHAALEAVLARHAAAGTPVLLRGASYLAAGAAASNWSNWSRWARAHVPAAAAAVVPVSLVFVPGGDTSRVEPLPPGLAPRVRASLERRSVHHALTRPAVHLMSLGDLSTLLDDGRCRRCYLKQARVDMHMPSLLAELTPPPLPRPAAGGIGGAAAPMQLGDAFLWLGGGGTRTGLHTDARPNLLAMLSGSKRLVLVPPHRAAALQPASMLDLASEAAEEGAEATPRLPSEAEVHLNHNHFRASWRDAAALKGACRLTLSAPDALFIPRAWPHAVRSVAAVGDAGPGVVAAVNFFYDE